MFSQVWLGTVFTIGAAAMLIAAEAPASRVLGDEPPPLDAATTARLQEALDKVAAREVTPGALLGVLVADRGVWIGASGLACFEPRRLAQPGDHYKIGSTTKTFTAAVILLLDQEGVLSLDDTLDRWVPNRYDNDDRITIRHLLRQRSGLVDIKGTEFWDRAAAEPNRVWRPEEVLAIARPMAKPGTMWSYSNAGYYLLGLVIEAATGKPWEQVVKHKLLDPLGMRDTYTNWLNVPAGRLMESYRYEDEQKDFVQRPIHPSATGASGTMASTARDMLTWCQALYGGTLLDKEHQAEMATPWSYFNVKTLRETKSGTLDDGVLGFGSAARIWKFRLGTAYEFGGSIEGFKSMMFALSDRKIFITAVVNQRTADRDDLIGAALRVLLGDEFPY